jgi:hypothetical protein
MRLRELVLAAVFVLLPKVAEATVTMTSPTDGSSVSGVVAVNCTDTNAGSSFGFYVDGSFQTTTSGAWSWDTSSASPGSHYVLCNAYHAGTYSGSASASVTVRSLTSTPSPAPTPTPTPIATQQPTPTVVSTPIPTQIPTPISTPLPTTSFDTKVNCTGTHDSDALEAAFKNPGRVLSHGPCGLDRPITVAADNTGFEGDGAPWTAAGSAIIFTTGANSYNTPAWRGLVLRGPGTRTGTVGLQVNGNFGSFANPDIQGFGTQIAIGANGYLDTFIDARLAGDGTAGTGILCPVSTNAGEGILLVGGKIFNLAVGSNNLGCGLTFIGTHMDALTASPVIVDQETGSFGAASDFVDAYIEIMTVPTSGAIFTLTGYNGYGSITWRGGQIQEDLTQSTPDLIHINNTQPSNSYAPFATFDRVRMQSVNTSPLPPHVAICGSTSLTGGGQLGNITSVGVCP